MFDLPGSKIPKKWDVEVVSGDIADAESVTEAAAGADTIFHLAAFIGDYGPWSRHEKVTVEGTRLVAGAAAASGARLVVSSSICAYGTALRNGPVTEETPRGKPTGRYDRAKQLQEDAALTSAADVAIVRPANVIGARSGPWVLALTETIRKGEPAIIGDGSGNAGLIYIENLLDILLLAAERAELPHRVFNACDRYGVTWRQYAEDLAKLIGAPPPKMIPRHTAWMVANAADALWRATGRQDRPPLTRSTVNLCGYPMLIDMTRTEETFGPLHSRPYSEALVEIAEYLDKNPSRTPTVGKAFG
ncbi:dihydroflavonol-4-reductase [Parvularcula lutaonensis]|nr:dihydroflavonol-4-reductase [Parvularcula lutaonensis]